MTPSRIAFQKQHARVTQKFSNQDNSFIHKLEVLIVCPNITILFFFKRGCIANRCLILNFNLLFIICPTIKWGIDINQLNLSPVFFQKMAHHLKIITPEDFVHPTVLFFTVRFTQLCRVILRRFIRPLARPTEFWKSFDGWPLCKLKGKLFYFAHFFILLFVWVYLLLQKYLKSQFLQIFSSFAQW